MLTDYDAQLRIRAVVPEFDWYCDRYRALSLQARSALGYCLDCAYGNSALERLDVFFPDSADRQRPVHIFFHGGYWRAFDKADYSFMAQPIVAAGAIAVIANYGLMPAVSMNELVAHCRAAIRWVHANAERFGGDPRRLSVSGHSAGAHIASLLHLTRWTEHGLPSDAIKSTIAVSGIYDLAPILQSFLKQETGMTEADARSFSPIAWAAQRDVSAPAMLLAFGADETSEFRQQSAAFARVLREAGRDVETHITPHRHHMNIVLDMADPNSELGRELSERILAAGSG
jgi:arylformamidase